MYKPWKKPHFCSISCSGFIVREISRGVKAKLHTLFYLFETDGVLIGAIYYFMCDDGKLFLNGFAKRKKHLLCIECLKMSLKWFKGSVYAEAQNRASALCLLKCGFKRVKDNLFKKVLKDT